MRISKIAFFLIISFILITSIQSDSFAAGSTSVKNDSNLVQKTNKLMKSVEEFRGLKFLKDLPVELLTQEEMALVIADELDKQLDADTDRKFSDLFITLGLINPNESIKGLYQEMAEEQVAGLYDSEKKKFYVVDIDMGSAIGKMFGMPEDLGAMGAFFEGLMGGLGLDLKDVIIVHELTHALDDQHYDIDSALKSKIAMESDDAQLAYQSLIEGNATRIMNDYTFKAIGMDPKAAGNYSAMNLQMVEQMTSYSPFMERIMLVPYLYGENFVRQLIETKGADALEKAYSEHPKSMEQILHPEKYTTDIDNPTWVDDPDITKILKGWTSETRTSLGELLIGVLFEMRAFDKSTADSIAQGWDGDRVQSFRSPDGTLAVAWMTVWDSEAEALDFFTNYKKVIERKNRTGSWTETHLKYGIFATPSLESGIEIDGDMVVVVENVPKGKAIECLDEVWKTDYKYH